MYVACLVYFVCLLMFLCLFVVLSLTCSSGEVIKRPYTPIANVNGSLHLLVKVYPKGIISSYLHSLQKGQIVTVYGPYGDFSLEEETEEENMMALSNKNTQTNMSPNDSSTTPIPLLPSSSSSSPSLTTTTTLIPRSLLSTSVSTSTSTSISTRYVWLIAAGTGIAPLYQVLLALLANSTAGCSSSFSSLSTNTLTSISTPTSISSSSLTALRCCLLYANRSETDILLEKELSSLTKAHSCFTMEHILSRVSHTR